MSENTKKAVYRRKRARDLMPELRNQIPNLFDLSGGNYQSVAISIGVSPLDVVAEVLYATRMGPGRENNNVIPLVRRAG